MSPCSGLNILGLGYGDWRMGYKATGVGFRVRVSRSGF